MIAVPASATAMPSTAPRLVRSPIAGPMIATHTGVVCTSTTLAATLVSPIAGIHDAKCAASATPEATSSHRSRRESRPSAPRWRRNAHGTRIRLANRHR